MLEFRITKYDPKYRLADGSYGRAEWTSVGDVGKSFCGVALTREEYDRTENAYVATAEAFLAEAGIRVLGIRALEDRAGRYPQYREGSAVPVNEVRDLLALILREELWCRLEAQDAFVHVGFDYYMYIGVPRPTPIAQRKAATLRLFVEPFKSPFHEE